jgi:hypothetical protein
MDNLRRPLLFEICLFEPRILLSLEVTSRLAQNALLDDWDYLSTFVK